MKARTKHRWWLLNALWASMLAVANVVLLAAGRYGAGWLLVALVPLTVVQWAGWWKTRPPRPLPAVRTDGSSMVDLGPTSPPLFYCIPKTVTEALELWHAAWERDHPELLGPLGPSFYGPEVEPLLAKREPLVPGITMAEACANVGAVAERLRSGPSAWERHQAEMRRLKEMHAEVQAIRAKLDALPPVPDLPPLHVDPLLIRWEKR